MYRSKVHVVCVLIVKGNMYSMVSVGIIHVQTTYHLKMNETNCSFGNNLSQKGKHEAASNNCEGQVIN
jgi:hypothetical protein